MPPDLPWPLQQRLWWLGQPQVPEPVVAAGPVVAAHLVPSEFELADGAFNAIARTPDGSIYYGLSSHRADLDARLLQLDHRAGRAAVVATMQETGGAAAHAKIHVPPVRPTTCLTSSSTARARRPSSRSGGPPMRWRCSARSTT
jgi:hypothetical protein